MENKMDNTKSKEEIWAEVSEKDIPYPQDIFEAMEAYHSQFQLSMDSDIESWIESQLEKYAPIHVMPPGKMDEQMQHQFRAFHSAKQMGFKAGATTLYQHLQSRHQKELEELKKQIKS